MSPDASEPRFEALADDAWLIHPAGVDDAAAADINATIAVHRFAARLRSAAPAWLRDLVPAWTSLAVFFDPERIDAEDARAWIAAQDAGEDREAPGSSSRIVEIPVRYGGAFGEDLDAAAAELGLTPDTLAARHRAPLYTVAMIGFAPGFPYLGGLDPGLALPRLATPRTRVPAGSVGIGGAQTGIYPRESPGGWRVIGRTPLTLFDPQRASPSLLAPGDRVRFVAIDDDAFARLVRAP
ncbi:5-oxoprolinase subunit PxpB [Lysobacter hankyongensis]|uniref:5-oxoprolinase subunit PxpB n=1 Tax=Lysobacter hankyongensis TaxID=1176535 RepID=UPI0031EDA2A0